jgi:phosphoglycerate dehydrogenase-like enzyme
MGDLQLVGHERLINTPHLAHSRAEHYRRIFGHFASLPQTTNFAHPAYAPAAP